MLGIEIIHVVNSFNHLLDDEELIKKLHYELFTAGFLVYKTTLLAEQQTLLEEKLEESLATSKVVILLGAVTLKPGDLLRQTVAFVLQKEFEVHREYGEELRRRFPALEESYRYVLFPKDAVILSNPLGPMPALLFNQQLVILPEKREETLATLKASVIPFLKTVALQEEKMNVRYLVAPASDYTSLIEETKKIFKQTNIVTVPHATLTRLFIVSHSLFMPSAIDEANNAMTYLKEKAPFLEVIGSLEEMVHCKMIENKKTLALAESCTGGAVAATLTQMPGASKYFLGSVVAYANELKIKLLHVPEELLEKYGAVSQETALAMSHGLPIQADFKVAITGIAGPSGGTREKPVGTVFLAINDQVFGLFAEGSRSEIIQGVKERLFYQLLKF